MYLLFGEDLGKFMMHSSNTQNRKILATCGITFNMQCGAYKKIFITKNSAIPPYFYNDPGAVQEEEEAKGSSVNAHVPQAVMEALYKTHFQERVDALAADNISESRSAGPYLQMQMSEMVTKRISDTLFAVCGAQHPDSRFVDEAKQALHFMHSNGTSQFKSRKQALLISRIARECGLKSFIHTYAPTSCFKCICDGAGADTKRKLRWLERMCQIRAHTPFLCFKAMLQHMGQPKVIDDDKKMLMTLTSRHHYYVVDQKRAGQADLQEEAVAPFIIFTNFERDEVDAEKIVGIQKLHQFRSDARGNFYKRKLACWCLSCRQGNFATCPGARSHGIEGWEQHRMAEVVVEESVKKAVAAVASYGWRMYKHVKPALDVHPTVVAVKHNTHGHGAVFCHVISKPWKCKRLTGGRFENAERSYAIQKDACCLKIRALELVAGRHDLFQYASNEIEFPLADTMIPRITEGNITPHDWLPATYQDGYIKITTQVQQKFPN